MPFQRLAWFNQYVIIVVIYENASDINWRHHKVLYAESIFIVNNFFVVVVVVVFVVVVNIW